MTDNGIETFEDLRSIKEVDIDTFGLNFGEKKRLENLLSSGIKEMAIHCYCTYNLFLVPVKGKHDCASHLEDLKKDDVKAKYSDVRKFVK